MRSVADSWLFLTDNGPHDPVSLTSAFSRAPCQRFRRVAVIRTGAAQVQSLRYIVFEIMGISTVSVGHKGSGPQENVTPAFTLEAMTNDGEKVVGTISSTPRKGEGRSDCFASRW